MKARITSKMKMYKSVLEVCKNYGSVWAEIPVFVSGVNEFEAKLEVLRAKSENQGTILMGVTNGKNTKYLVLVDHLQILHVYSCANEINLFIHIYHIDNSIFVKLFECPSNKT